MPEEKYAKLESRDWSASIAAARRRQTVISRRKMFLVFLWLRMSSKTSRHCWYVLDFASHSRASLEGVHGRVCTEEIRNPPGESFDDLTSFFFSLKFSI